MRKTLFLAIASLSLLPMASSLAQDIYKWKDASGNTHYSEAPPPSGAFTQQEGARSPATTAPAAVATQANTKNGAQAPPPAANDARCDTARKNLATLQGDQSVLLDENNDGKPDKTLSNEERASQMEMTRATLKAYNCSEAAASS